MSNTTASWQKAAEAAYERLVNHWPEWDTEFLAAIEEGLSVPEPADDEPVSPLNEEHLEILRDHVRRALEHAAREIIDRYSAKDQLHPHQFGE